MRLKPVEEGRALPASHMTNELLGEVQSIMYLGVNEQYSLRLADNAIVHAVEYDPIVRNARVGDRLAVQFDCQAVTVLPQEDLGD
jgi:hypothetical protein